MLYGTVIRLRKILVEELLKNDNIEPVKLPFDRNLLRQLIFDKEGCFSEELKDVLEKIDFSNVSFDGFKAKDIDFSKYTGIHLNPQTIKNKDLSGSNCSGVKIIGSLDNVNKTNANLENAILEIDIIEDPHKEKTKSLVFKSINKQ